MSGVQMAAGDKVSMWYCSANRDETKFDNPWLFDVARNPNPHLGFGGGGAHFCLGANLARREIAVAFDELHRRIPDVGATEEPARLLSAFIHGIKQLPIAWTPPSRCRTDADQPAGINGAGGGPVRSAAGPPAWP